MAMLNWRFAIYSPSAISKPMQIKLDSASDQELKCRAVELLAHGVIPFEQWAHVFANPNFMQWPGLQAKAFSVWFPTMVEFLQGSTEVSAIQGELAKRKIETEPLFELILVLGTCYADIMTLYSTEDQLFIRDRRLQNVHGRLQLGTFKEHDVLVFDPQSKSPQRVKIAAQAYRDLMVRYYSGIQGNSKQLLSRLIDSQEFVRLSDLYTKRLKVADHFVPLIAKLGVAAVAGSSDDS